MYPRHSEKWMKPVMKELYKSFSYGKFLLENPNATRADRQKAVKRFWEHSTGSTALGAMNPSKQLENRSSNELVQAVENRTKKV